jgi:hypothetical protein
MPSDQSLIFPVGHYVGAFYPGVGAALSHHSVRIGNNSYKLNDDQELGVWALAHGVPGQVNPATPWGRPAITAAADPDKVVDVDATLDALLEREMLVEVAPGSGDAVTFARELRLRALLAGTGNDEQYPGMYGIGTLAGQPVVVVPAELFELWEWGPVFDNLWHACQLFAQAARETERLGTSGDGSPPATDPEVVLDGFLPNLHVLLAHGAAYLDEAAAEE